MRAADQVRHHEPGARRRRGGAGGRRVRRRASWPTSGLDPAAAGARPAAQPTWWPGCPAPTRRWPPLLVHAHLDVVPADPAEWTVPPFSGEIRDGFVWGRGAVDMKDMCATLLDRAAPVGGATGRGPRRDIVLAFVADEEDSGDCGARTGSSSEHRELFDGVRGGDRRVRRLHRARRPADGEPSGSTPSATAERGTAHLRLTATGRAGHGSRPQRRQRRASRWSTRCAAAGRPPVAGAC